MSARTAVGRHTVDVLTLLVLALAVFVALQRGSPLRTAWASHRSEVAAKHAAGRLWPQLAELSSPLFAAGATPEIIKVSDYECRFCRIVHAGVDSAIAAGVKISLLHLPSPTRAQSEGAAIAAMCAEKAGRFPEMHARLMETSIWRSDGNWAREAQVAGIEDLSAFERCLASAEVRDRVAHHRRLADSLQVRATPTFITRAGFRVGVVSTLELIRLSGRR